MARAMWCTSVNGSHGTKCQMRKLWENNKFMKIRKNREIRHVARRESEEEVTNSINDNQKREREVKGQNERREKRNRK